MTNTKSKTLKFDINKFKKFDTIGIDLLSAAANDIVDQLCFYS